MRIQYNQDAIDALVRDLSEDGGNNGRTNGSSNGHQNRSGTVLRPDEVILEKCRTASNGAKFSDLYDRGDVYAYHGGDDSVADLGLVTMMAFYTQDREQLDRLFRCSSLYRQKWERENYRNPTIDKALKSLKETYSWPEDGPAASGILFSRNGLSEEPQTGTDDAVTVTVTPNSSGNGNARPRLTSTAFVDMPAPEPRRYLVEDLVPEAYPSMIYGDGGVAKSLLALSLGLAVASGAGTWLGRRVESGAVLYLDFELDAVEQMRRVSRLAQADGLGKLPSDIRYMSAVGVRARDAFADALEECQVYGIRLLIVDSLGPALEGDAEASRDVIAFYNEVVGPFRAAGVAPLVIDHQSKLQAGERYQNKRAFGSVFKSNLARSVVQVQATNRDDGELTVRIRQNKHNFGSLLKPFGAHLTFTEEWIRIGAVELDDGDLAEEGTLNARERVMLALNQLGEGTPSEIHELVPDLTLGTVKKELSKLKGDGKVEDTEDVRERQKVVRPAVTVTGPYKGNGNGNGGSEDASEGLFEEEI